MKSRRAILILLLLLALGGGLAWEFWPQDTSAPTANSSPAKPTAPKVADAPKSTPVHIVTVEAPKIAAALPKDVPTVQPIAGGLPQPPLAPHFMDLGRVEFANSVPMDIALTTGELVTLIAAEQPDGTLEIHLKNKIYDARGHTSSESDSVTHTQIGQQTNLTMLSGSGITLVPFLKK